MMRGLSLDEALATINGAFAAAAARKLRPLTAIVLDAGGRVKAFLKQDGSSLLRFEMAYGKAFAALSLGRSSQMVVAKAQEKPLFIQSLERLSDGPIFLERGGQIIRDQDGEVIGAIGITGDAGKMDDLCAIEGIHAAGFRSDGDFEGEESEAANVRNGKPSL